MKLSRQRLAQIENEKAGRCRSHKDRPIYKIGMCEECYQRQRAVLDARRNKPQLTPFARLLSDDRSFLTRNQKDFIISCILDGTAEERLIEAMEKPNRVDHPSYKALPMKPKKKEAK